jgi:IS1 family transposase
VAALPAFEDTLLPSQNGDVLELDELWSFVQKKTQECWLWIALCRRTRQIVAYTVGDRSQEGALSLREHVPDDYRRRATRSDFWLAYEAAFPQRTHRFCGKAEGETNHAERWFGTLRARLSRLVRKTYSFSKRVERHLETIHLFIASYNLSIKQATIT